MVSCMSVFVVLALVVVSCVLVFLNNILYVLSILFLSSYVLFFMVSNGLVGVLSFILIVVVYVGAMMVLIGYICAVCPNPVLLPRLEFGVLGFLVLTVSLIAFPFEFFLGGSVKVNSLSDIIFSVWGVSLFLSVVLMLFVTLLMVTSQSSSPQGPFRSV